jgi:hypothetical protein
MIQMAVSMLGLGATAAILAACAREPQQPAASPSTPATPAASSVAASSLAALLARPDACPLARLRGVRADVADVPGGVAILFDGPDRVVDLLRANVRAMATVGGAPTHPLAICVCRAGSQEASADASAAERIDLGRTSMQPPSSPTIPPSAATMEETPSGAKLLLRAEDGPDVAVLRTAARQNVSAMTPCFSQEGL